MKQQRSPEKIDLFKNTFRASMPLTDDYVFHAVFGRDTEESRAALIEILNIILERKQDPIRAIVIENPIEIPDREADKESVMDIRAETESGELLRYRDAGRRPAVLSKPRAFLRRQTRQFRIAGRRKL